jgi:hypothetical protein
MAKATLVNSNFPAFPLDIMHGLAKEFVDLYSPIRETPPEFLWLAFVTYLGNLLSPYIGLDCAASEPRFYGVAIGKSGRTRKSAGQNAAKDVFEQVHSSQTIIQGFGSTEGVLYSVRAKGENPSPKTAIIHLDEMNQMAAKTGIAGSAGFAPLHKLFEDHDYHHPLAKGEGYTVRNVYLSLLGASTLEDFQKSWDSKHADAGTFSRLFVVAADSKTRIPRPMNPNPEALEHLVQRIQQTASTLQQQPRRTMTMSPDAEQLWKTFYMENFRDDVEWNRIDTYGFRFMALQTILRDEAQVTKKNVQEVIDLLLYEVATRRAVNPVVAENDFARIEELIRRHLPEGTTMSKRELGRAINAHRYGIRYFDTALFSLQGNHEIGMRRDRGNRTLVTRLRDEETASEVSSTNLMTGQVEVTT